MKKITLFVILPLPLIIIHFRINILISRICGSLLDLVVNSPSIVVKAALSSSLSTLDSLLLGSLSETLLFCVKDNASMLKRVMWYVSFPDSLSLRTPLKTIVYNPMGWKWLGSKKIIGFQQYWIANSYLFVQAFQFQQSHFFTAPSQILSWLILALC